jgi:hypothetical protein
LDSQSGSSSSVKGEDQSYSHALSKGLSKRVPKDVNALATRMLDRFKTDLRVEDEIGLDETIPYYCDTSTDTYSMITSDGTTVDDSHPFNISVVSRLGYKEDANISLFKDTSLASDAQYILDDLATYIHQVHHGCINWLTERGKSSRSALFKDVNMYLASLFWEFQTGKQLLIPNELVDSFQKNKLLPKKSDGKTWESSLRQKLIKFNSGDNKVRMACGFITLLRSAFVESYQTLGKEKWLEILISKHKKFTPSFVMLRMSGCVPDVKVGRYASLFTPSEWERVKSEATIVRLEPLISELSRKKIVANDVLPVLKQLEDARVKAEGCSLTKTYREIRSKRLQIASSLKRTLKRGQALNLAREVANNLASSTIRDAFNPFRILFAGRDVEITPTEAMTFVHFDEDLKIFFMNLPVTENESEFRKLCRAGGIDFCEWLK